MDKLHIFSLKELYLVKITQGKEKGNFCFAFQAPLEKNCPFSASKLWYVLEGKRYGLQCPKRKNKKHLSVIKVLDEAFIESLKCSWQICLEHYCFQKKIFGIEQKYSSRDLKQRMKERKKKAKKLRMLFEKGFEKRQEKKSFRIFQNKQKQANAEIRQKLMQLTQEYAIIEKD